MALADIITKIDTDAAAAATAITEAAAVEAAAIKAAATAEVERIKTESVSDVTRTESKVKERAIAAAQHEAKFALQSLKVSAINNVFSEVEKELKAMTGDAHKAFVTARATSLKGHSGVVTVDTAREADTIAALSAAGVTATEVTKAPIGGGFILDSEHARFDHSFETVITRAREELASEVASALFVAK